jgi:hypothetical protein
MMSRSLSRRLTRLEAFLQPAKVDWPEFIVHFIEPGTMAVVGTLTMKDWMRNWRDPAGQKPADYGIAAGTHRDTPISQMTADDRTWREIRTQDGSGDCGPANASQHRRCCPRCGGGRKKPFDDGCGSRNSKPAISGRAGKGVSQAIARLQQHTSVAGTNPPEAYDRSERSRGRPATGG